MHVSSSKLIRHSTQTQKVIKNPQNLYRKSLYIKSLYLKKNMDGKLHKISQTLMQESLKTQKQK